MVVLGVALFLVNRAQMPRTSAPATVLESNQSTTMMTLSSPAFVNNGLIPSRFSCDGENISPELLIEGVPDTAKSLVLLMDDPDIPELVKEKIGIRVFEHWNLFNLPATTRVIAEHAAPEGAVVGKNSAGASGYRGPCPPDGEHRYFFKLYALDSVIELGKEATASEIQEAMHGHILESTELLGRYTRSVSQE